MSGSHPIATRPSAPPPQGMLHSAPVPAYVELARVRALYEQYMRVVGPVAKAVFETELRALRRLPSTLTERDCDFLIERLTARIPVVGARARFLALAHDLFA